MASVLIPIVAVALGAAGGAAAAASEGRWSGERVRVARGPRVGQVVVAWIVDTVEVVDPHLTKIDLGHRHKTRAAVEGRSVMWARSGTEADIAKADKYAREEAGKAAGDPYATGRDHRVFVYSPSERDPLGRARREVVR